MKKSISVIAGSILLIISLFTCLNINKTDVHKEENDVPEVTHRNMLSMMLETDSGSGEYTLETRSSWPTKADGYIFNSTLSKCENGSKLSWDDENNLVLMEGTTSDKCYVYFDVYVELPLHESCNDNTLACYVAKQHTGTQGDNNLYYHDSSLENGAGDNSYRYAGSTDTVNNFVCFGSDAATCPDDNLYRIIGVFENQVKLIKWDYANSNLLGTNGDYYTSDTYSASNFSNYTGSKETINRYYWNKVNYNTSYNATKYYNDWSYSELNKTNLNTNFLANIGTKWANIIDTTTWKVGGFADVDVIPAIIYTNEITSPSSQVTSTYDSKVGLMYVSDYAFAAAPSAWTTSLYEYDENDENGNKITKENWMYMGLWELTMSRSSSSISRSVHVFSNGNVVNFAIEDGVNIDAYAVRPVFHLKSQVEILAGEGTKENPLKIRLGN